MFVLISLLIFTCRSVDDVENFENQVPFNFEGGGDITIADNKNKVCNKQFNFVSISFLIFPFLPVELLMMLNSMKTKSPSTLTTW